ncbi:hypothetical protein D3C71_1449410 [compost metagenome]
MRDSWKRSCENSPDNFVPSSRVVACCSTSSTDGHACSDPTQTARGDHGPVRPGRVTPNSASSRADAAAATWDTPESLHTTNAARAVSAANAPSGKGGSNCAVGALRRASSVSAGGGHITTVWPRACKARVSVSNPGQTLILPLCSPVAVGAISTKRRALSPAACSAWSAASWCDAVSGRSSVGPGCAGPLGRPQRVRASRVRWCQDCTACKVSAGLATGQRSRKLRPSSR